MLERPLIGVTYDRRLPVPVIHNRSASSFADSGTDRSEFARVRARRFEINATRRRLPPNTADRGGKRVPGVDINSAARRYLWVRTPNGVAATEAAGRTVLGTPM